MVAHTIWVDDNGTAFAGAGLNKFNRKKPAKGEPPPNRGGYASFCFCIYGCDEHSLTLSRRFATRCDVSKGSPMPRVATLSPRCPARVRNLRLPTRSPSSSSACVPPPNIAHDRSLCPQARSRCLPEVPRTSCSTHLSLHARGCLYKTTALQPALLPFLSTNFEQRWTPRKR